MFKKVKPQALAFLAAVGLLGYAAASGRLLFPPEAEAAPPMAGVGPSAVFQGQPEQAIFFDVLLPADATLTIDGTRTRETGALRHFQTPPLPVGSEYTYTLKVTHQGKEVTRELHLRHGPAISLDLRTDFPAAAPVRAAVAAKPARRGGPVEQSGGNPKDEAAIAKNGEAFVAAFQKGDAKALASFWAPDGTYTDLAGRTMKGREAIEKAFASLFAANKGLRLRIESDSLRFPTTGVAIEEGTTEVLAPDAKPPSRVHFTNVHVKKDGQWLLSSVRDSAFTPPSNLEHLRVLEWAVGDWDGTADAGEVERISLGWAPNQNFLIGSFSTTVKNVSVGSAVQWIGWDPVAMTIRSWMFDESGAFGDGIWTRDGDKWMIKSAMVLPTGQKATATFILTPVDADTITLQSRDRSLDGQAIPDTKPVKLKRVK
jgi:uncharacterized protein (TIGR02246 family)